MTVTDRDLNPIDPEYLRTAFIVAPGERLHRLLARLSDSYIDDLSDDLIEGLERTLDAHRICHADGAKFGSKPHG
ncbi:hypothetical protein [Mesorhizobium ventifaucium]|uniref:Uncharacterized protein n=1 Tax=Mesorhizobium ventifaucium TaxID=666020 RepID=A0ABN8JLV4_9HYPH|nr:hypothetical protein [Mesorhizobium ventifaucium]CAH2399104.1 hypothetical protein MES4922_210093 [Mesorhizobium ventifaucium]